MTEPLRVGLIGAGAIAQSYIEALEGRPDCRLTAVVDTRQVVAASVAEQLGATRHDSHQALADSGMCDAAIVATPPASHAPNAAPPSKNCAWARPPNRPRRCTAATSRRRL